MGTKFQLRCEIEERSGKKMAKFYPVSSPDIGELEKQYVINAVESGWISSIGPFVDQFEKAFSKFCNTDHGVAMSNGTDALFIALKAMGVSPGDEVIVPALTFAAVPAVVLHLGATPVLVDVHPDYWCMDPIAVENAISKKTKAIIAVHSYGHPADMDPIMAAAKMNGIRVVEDCAEAHGARYKGRIVGSIGDAGCFSFYGNKILTTGEGGMIVTNDKVLSDRCRFLKDHAMDPNRRYYHPEAGYNCRMTNVQAAIGCAQLERFDELIGRRARILNWYRDGLSGQSELVLNAGMEWASPVNWMICGVLEERMVNQREQLFAGLKSEGVDTRPFFLPVHSMPVYQNCRLVGQNSAKLSQTERLSLAGFNLPSSPGLTQADVQIISAKIRQFLEG